MILVRTKPSLYLPAIMAIWVSHIPRISDRFKTHSTATATLQARNNHKDTGTSADQILFQGVLTCLMALIDSYEHLVVLRIFVGIIEAGFAPGILLIISSWYKKNEQSRRFAVFMSAAILSGAFGGLLAGAITSGLEGARGLRGWR
jgi:MFS family permease